MYFVYTRQYQYRVSQSAIWERKLIGPEPKMSLFRWWGGGWWWFVRPSLVSAAVVSSRAGSMLRVGWSTRQACWEGSPVAVRLWCAVDVRLLHAWAFTAVTGAAGPIARFTGHIFFYSECVVLVLMVIISLVGVVVGGIWRVVSWRLVSERR